MIFDKLKKNNFYLFRLLTVGLVFFLASCDSGKREPKTRTQIVVSTLMIAEGVSYMTRESADVIALMGPGVDPHLFRPSANDLQLLRNADIIILNGLHLEGRMGEMMEALRKEKTVLLVTDFLAKEDILFSGDDLAQPDPHCWMAPGLWAKAMRGLGVRLKELLATDTAITRHTEFYADSLLRLDSMIRTGLAQVPPAARVLVTSHDAFRYFGRAYGWEVRGLQGISTASDIGIREIGSMADFLRARRIRAVFPESSVSARNLEAVLAACKARNHSVNIAPPLYTDAPGSEGTSEATYSGMLLHNQQILTRALK